MSDQTTTSPTDNAWRSRIVAAGDEDPQQLLANPKNWRIHPKYQQDALTKVMDKVGWVQTVVVNQRTGFVLDGHLRVSMAVSRLEATVPVSYVDLDESEEDLLLAGMDPLSTLAIADPEALNALLETDTDGELAGLFASSDLGWDENTPVDTDLGPITTVDADGNETTTSPGDAGYPDLPQADGVAVRADNEYVLVCPECGEEFSVFVDEGEGD
jgi:hypothetical protein